MSMPKSDITLFLLAVSTPLLGYLIPCRESSTGGETWIPKLKPDVTEFPELGGVAVEALARMGVGDSCALWPRFLRGIEQGRHLRRLIGIEGGVPMSSPSPFITAFTIGRIGDLVLSLTLKIEGTSLNLENMYDRVELNIGGTTVGSLSMRQCIYAAEFNEVLPTRSNGSGQVTTLPIMFPGQLFPIPIVAMFYHEMRLLLFSRSANITNRTVLDVEFAYLKSNHRGAVIEGSRHETKRVASIVLNPTPSHHVNIQYDTTTVTVSAHDGHAHVPLRNMYLPCSELVLEPKFPKNLPEWFAPINTASVWANGKCICCYDLADMSEYLWLRAKKPPPKNNLKLLVPFSCDYALDGCLSKVCLMDCQGYDCIELRLRTHPMLDGFEFGLSVCATVFNVSGTANGMYGMWFAK